MRARHLHVASAAAGNPEFAGVASQSRAACHSKVLQSASGEDVPAWTRSGRGKLFNTVGGHWQEPLIMDGDEATANTAESSPPETLNPRAR